MEILIFFVLALFVVSIIAIMKANRLEEDYKIKWEAMNLKVKHLESDILDLKSPNKYFTPKYKNHSESFANENTQKTVAYLKGVPIEEEKPNKKEMEVSKAEVESEKNRLSEKKFIKETVKASYTNSNKKKESQVVRSKPAEPSEWLLKWRAFCKTVDWEQFTGVKLFAWLGSLAFFCGAAFFVKYSIDRNLIPPSLRLAIGSLTGIALLASSVKIDRKKYETTSSILAACGIGVLYTVVFGAAHLYHYISNAAGIGLLALISMAAFVFSVRLKAVSISTLGALGAYGAPILLNTGHANLPGLFVYLAIVNIGVFEVVRRLMVPGLLLLSTSATFLLLTLGAWGGSPEAEPWVVAGVGAAFLFLFGVILDWVPEKWISKKEIHASRAVLLIGALFWSLALIQNPGPYPILLATVGLILAIRLGLKHESWSRAVLPYGVLSFVVALLWILLRFETKEVSWDFLFLLIYGLLGGLGPILLVKKYGFKTQTLNWFVVFPVVSLLLTLLILCKDPETSFWIWPIVLGFHLMGLFLGILVGQTLVVGVLSALTLVNVLLWVLRSPVVDFGAGFHLFLLAGGVMLCVVTLWFMKLLPGLAGSMGFCGTKKKPGQVSEIQAEWFSSFPALGSFFLLGTVFLVQRPLQPDLGMAVGLCFLVVALTLGSRIGSQPLMMTALGASVLSQSCWMLRLVQDGDPLHLNALAWSGGLWLAALLTPRLFIRPPEIFPKVWCAWALFEWAQAVLFLRSSMALWPQEVMGWFPLVLCLLKMLLVKDLLVQLKDRVEHNLILAFHGGVLLFYISALPVLLLDHGWLGLTLVFESMALLWLNRRIEHPGLPWVAACLAPVGLGILIPALHQLRTMDSTPILNFAVGAVALAVAALWSAVFLCPKEKRNFPFKAYFYWLAIGLGFFLLNLIVADVFGNGKGGFQFFSKGDLLQFFVYSLLWAVCGTVLWRAQGIPKGLQWVGVGLVFLGWFRLMMFPAWHPQTINAMPPFWNMGLVFYGAMIMILVFLIVHTTDESHKSVRFLFLALLVLLGFCAMMTEFGTVFQPKTAGDLFASHNSGMALATALGWFLYGLGVYLWPRVLAKPFRITGIILATISVGKVVCYPFAHKMEMGQVTPLLNAPTFLMLGIVCVLGVLTLWDFKKRWPFSSFSSRVFWGILLGVFAFFTLNVLIVELFGSRSHDFSFETFGRFSQQLAYSLSWLMYAIALLWVGIRWKTVQVRWAALALFSATALKIFFMDLWSLGQLYRVASFVGLAAVLILVSYLYQRFLSREKKA